MEGTIEALQGLFAITMPIWIVWIIFHYRAKSRAGSSLNEEELRQIEELSALSERMAERIKTLESILDAQTPEWREYEQQHEQD